MDPSYPFNSIGCCRPFSEFDRKYIFVLKSSMHKSSTLPDIDTSGDIDTSDYIDTSGYIDTNGDIDKRQH
ncbi:hypothetical protein Trydic_g2081 [Trypoxylus dichotomus]